MVANMLSYSEFKKNYKWTIKNYPNITSLYGVSGDVAIITETRYIKACSKWVIKSTERETVTSEYVLNTIEAVPFFRGLGGRERVTRSYTKRGYMPVEITSISPDGLQKVSRRIDYI